MAQGKQINKDKFGIESYMAKILDKGVSSSNLYEFEVLASKEMRRFMDANAKKQGGADLFPKFTGDKTGQAVQRMNLLCQDIQIPGSTFNSVDVRMPKKGLTQKMAAAKMYNELDSAKIRPAIAYKNLRNAKRSNPRDCQLIWDENYSYSFYNKSISVGTLWYCD